MVHRMHPRSHVVKVHAYLASISFALSVLLCRFPPSLVAFVPFHPSFAKILTDALCTDGCIGKRDFFVSGRLVGLVRPGRGTKEHRDRGN